VEVKYGNQEYRYRPDAINILPILQPSSPFRRQP